MSFVVYTDYPLLIRRPENILKFLWQ